MIHTAKLRYPDTLRIGFPDGAVEYGCNQERYTEFWKRMAGCGPCVAATIFGYLSWRGETRGSGDWLALMDDVWLDVTPTMRGIPSNALLTERIEKYIARKGLPLGVAALDIPKEVSERPPLEDFLGFITRSLENDVPVAFLTLDPGDVPTLDEWHWTIIAAIDADADTAVAVNYNCGEVVSADLRRWYGTTRLGGGVVTLY
ncbi:MAG: hypothetical protein LBS90_03015 [Oscillospiraceae bacterium]|jgi:hypothetical protein|nr:hypothetical protein [Oscillospiraceae bacterium]